MALSDARTFFDKLRSDPSLGAKVKAAGAEGSPGEALARVANEAGFACSVADLEELAKQVAGELNEAQLGEVAGGLNFASSPLTVTAAVDSFSPIINRAMQS